jgi:hypothetical protein
LIFAFLLKITIFDVERPVVSRQRQAGTEGRGREPGGFAWQGPNQSNRLLQRYAYKTSSRHRLVADGVKFPVQMLFSMSENFPAGVLAHRDMRR